MFCEIILNQITNLEGHVEILPPALPRQYCNFGNHILNNNAKNIQSFPFFYFIICIIFKLHHMIQF